MTIMATGFEHPVQPQRLVLIADAFGQGGAERTFRHRRADMADVGFIQRNIDMLTVPR